VKHLYFSKNTFGKNFTLELNEEEVELLHSMLEFTHRESGEMGSLYKRISHEETELAEKLFKEIQPYIEELEYEVK
jgi:phage-related protein